MRSRLALLILVGSPALALAQPAPPPSAPPPPPGDGSQPPYDPNAGSPPPYSQPPPSGPYGQPPPNGGPAYGPGQNTQPYGQPYAQPYAQPPAPPLRSGMTFEASLGVGWLRITDNDSSDSLTSDLGAGIGIGVGGWVNEKLAITGRISGTSVTFEEFGGDIRFNEYLLGGAVQYWVDDHFWVGGGAGIAVLAASSGGESDSTSGFGLQGRVGYSFATDSENTFNVQFELTPGFYSENNSGGTATGVAVMVGYQHL